MRVLAIVSMLVVAGPAVAYGYREAEVRDAAARAGFESIADRVAAASLPTVLVGRRMLERAPWALGTSRFGGHPDLPAGTRWPRCGGQAQTFLGQVRLSDLPSDAEPLRAHDGVLLFFTHVRMESPGYGLWAGRCTSVLHAPEGAALTRTRPPRGSRLLRLRPAEMRFRMRPDIPDTDVNVDRVAAPLSDIRLAGREVERVGPGGGLASAPDTAPAPPAGPHPVPQRRELLLEPHAASPRRLAPSLHDRA